MVSKVHRPKSEHYVRVAKYIRTLVERNANNPNKKAAVLAGQDPLKVDGKRRAVTHDEFEGNIAVGVWRISTHSNANIAAMADLPAIRPLEYYGDRDFSTDAGLGGALAYTRGLTEKHIRCSHCEMLGQMGDNKEPVFPECVSITEGGLTGSGERFLLAGNCAACYAAGRTCSLRIGRQLFVPDRIGGVSTRRMTAESGRRGSGQARSNMPVVDPEVSPDPPAGQPEVAVVVPSTPQGLRRAVAARDSARATRSSQRQSRFRKPGEKTLHAKKHGSQIVHVRSTGEEVEYSPEPDPKASGVAGHFAFEESESGQRYDFEVSQNLAREKSLDETVEYLRKIADELERGERKEIPRHVRLTRGRAPSINMTDRSPSGESEVQNTPSKRPSHQSLTQKMDRLRAPSSKAPSTSPLAPSSVYGEYTPVVGGQMMPPNQPMMPFPMPGYYWPSQQFPYGGPPAGFQWSGYGQAPPAQDPVPQGYGAPPQYGQPLPPAQYPAQQAQGLGIDYQRGQQPLPAFQPPSRQVAIKPEPQQGSNVGGVGPVQAMTRAISIRSQSDDVRMTTSPGVRESVEGPRASSQGPGWTATPIANRAASVQTAFNSKSESQSPGASGQLE